MDPNLSNAAAKAAISTLRESINIGKEGAKIVTDIQADNHKFLMQEKRKRELGRAAEEKLGSIQEAQAYKTYLNRIAEAKATEELQASIIQKHGEQGWKDYLKVKDEIVKRGSDERKAMSDDNASMIALAIASFIVACIIVYCIY